MLVDHQAFGVAERPVNDLAHPEPEDIARVEPSVQPARASGPRNSHLFRGETSQTPRSSRTPWYSAASSPKPSVQYHPPSSMKVAPRAAMDS